MVDDATEGTLLDNEALRRRKTDRYERPSDDHDTLTALWVMFIHFCDEQATRHVESRRAVAELRKDIAEHRSSQNFKVDGLESAFEAKLQAINDAIRTLREQNLKEVGAFELFKIVIATTSSTCVALTLILKIAGVI